MGHTPEVHCRATGTKACTSHQSKPVSLAQLVSAGSDCYYNSFRPTQIVSEAYQGMHQSSKRTVQERFMARQGAIPDRTSPHNGGRGGWRGGKQQAARAGSLPFCRSRSSLQRLGHILLIDLSPLRGQCAMQEFTTPGTKGSCRVRVYIMNIEQQDIT